jgi:hypothetical protein
VNIIPSAPLVSLISTTQAGQPTALNIVQASSSQPSTVVGTQPAFLSGNNASPAVPASASGVPLLLQSPGNLASAGNPLTLGLVFPFTNFPTAQPLQLPNPVLSQPANNPVTFPDLGYFALGTEATLREGFESDLPANASPGQFQLIAPPPAQLPVQEEAAQLRDSRRAGEQPITVIFDTHEWSWIDTSAEATPSPSAAAWQQALAEYSA